MKFLILALVLVAVRDAHTQYLLVMKNDRFNSYTPDTLCISKDRETLTLVSKEERKSVPLDTVKFLTFREKKSWWPYLLAAAFAGGSTYTFFHFTSQNDAMFTGEGKARFGGFFWGGMVLYFGAMLKEPIETRTIINLGMGINRTEAFVSCTF